MSDNVAWEYVPPRFREYLRDCFEHFSPRCMRIKNSGLHSFAGKRQLQRSFRKLGLDMCSCDTEFNAVRHNCVTKTGQNRYLRILCTISFKPDSFAWIDPPCANFLWVCSSEHGRTNDNPYGDTSNPVVEYNNEIAEFVADLIWTCYALKMFYVLEQPPTSRLLIYPSVAKALEGTCASNISLQLWKFGAVTVKPVSLRGTVPWLQQLQEVANRIHALPSGSKPEEFPEDDGKFYVPYPTETLTTTNDQGQVTGRKEEMERSANYPKGLCDTIAFLHFSHLQVKYVWAVAKILSEKYAVHGSWFPTALLQFLAAPSPAAWAFLWGFAGACANWPSSSGSKPQVREGSRLQAWQWWFQ